MEWVEKRSPSIGPPILISLALHALLLASAPFLVKLRPETPFSPTAAAPAEQIMRVRFADPPKPIESTSPEGRVVDVMDQSHVTEKAPSDARFLSEKNRTVDKETQARITGANPTVSAGQAGEGKGLIGKALEKALQSKNEPGKKLDLHIPSSFLEKAAPLRTPQPEIPGGGGGGPMGSVASLAPSNYLPEIEVGDETLLNTREYVFASFYVRMKRQMEAFWNPQAIIYSGRLKHNQYITVVTIILEPDGKVKSARLAQTSGDIELDRAALYAVNKGAPYLNPPMALVGPDGYIQIPNWHFIVTLGGIF